MPHLTTHGGFMPMAPSRCSPARWRQQGFISAPRSSRSPLESAEPEKSVADAMQSVIWRVLIFYVGSIFLVVSIVAWNDKISMQQPT
jgi:GABA permease